MVSAQFSFARVLPLTFISQYIIDHQSLDLVDPRAALGPAWGYSRIKVLCHHFISYCLEARDTPSKYTCHPGSGFMVVVDFTNLILRHVQTPKTCCRLILGVNSIDILDGLNPSLNPSLNHFSIQCLPKCVLNLVLNPSLNPSLNF